MTHTSTTQPNVWLKYQIHGESGWPESEPRPNPSSWSTGSRAGTYPAAPRQELIHRRCQAAGTKGHFYKMLLMSLSFQSLQTSENPLVFCQLCMPLLMLSKLVPSLQVLRPGTFTFAHSHSSRSNLESKEWRFPTFGNLNNVSIWYTSSGKEAKTSWQTNFNTFCRSRRNEWGIWSACCFQTKAGTLFFSANELKKQ